MVKFPSIFVNHGGGPLPLLGKQPDIVQNMKYIVENYLKPLKEEPKAIIMISAHWESSSSSDDDSSDNDNSDNDFRQRRRPTVRITASEKPNMIYDYYGFPKESYTYEYPAPGSPKLAHKIHDLFQQHNINSILDYDRGYDHGIYIPLMIMYPNANIPVVCISLDGSLDTKSNMEIGKALRTLRTMDNDNDDVDPTNNNNDTDDIINGDGILIIGSGYTFHNMNAFFNPSSKTIDASIQFNTWLKSTILLQQQQEENNNGEENGNNNGEDNGKDGKDDTCSNGGTSKSSKYDVMYDKLVHWESLSAPYGRICHPREEHLLPLLMIAATATDEGMEQFPPQLIYDTTTTTKTKTTNASGSNGQLSEHAVTGYLFN